MKKTLTWDASISPGTWTALLRLYKVYRQSYDRHACRTAVAEAHAALRRK